MNFTQDVSAIATLELKSYLEQQVSEVAPEPRTVRTPQRRAKYHDKDRWRLKDLKAIAFRTYCVNTTAQIKKYLEFLGINLDCRYTSAWYAIAHELRDEILAAKAVVDALEPPQRSKIPSSYELLQVARLNGTVAYWHEDEEEKGIFHVWKPNSPKPELVTSTWLPMYLRNLAA